jgi:hypothetical protein
MDLRGTYFCNGFPLSSVHLYPEAKIVGPRWQKFAILYLSEEMKGFTFLTTVIIANHKKREDDSLIAPDNTETVVSN